MNFCPRRRIKIEAAIWQWGDTYFLCYLDLRMEREQGEKDRGIDYTMLEESLAPFFQGYKSHPNIHCSGSLPGTIHTFLILKERGQLKLVKNSYLFSI